MQGGNLKCSATNCAFNQSSECRAGAINIRGAQAVTTAGTGCSSYVDRSSNSFTNCADCGCTDPSNIRCEACNCTYNENKNCTADNVRIDAYKACCDTFTSGK
ncbi:MAG: DUF1540 domain-containing protein, partial [Terrisporobacter sp.]|uniref:DUF1540 domain-containing protein n=1 Tax=Terrisporobacter sp. TaxID=1965305 RepID=UPI002FC91203